MPIKTFTPSVLTSADMNTYLMEQSVITATSSTRPSSPVEGMTVYETDTDCYVTYSGTAWVYTLGGPWSAYTPTLTNFTLGNGTMAARWTTVGKTVSGRFRFNVGSTSTFPGGLLAISLPVAGASTYASEDTLGHGHIHNNTTASRTVVTARAAAASPSSLELIANGGGVSNTSPFSPWVTGAAISVHFNYESA